MKKNSIMMNLNIQKCFLCGAEGHMEVHHCLHGTANRRLADADGLKVNLCMRCHRALHDRGEHDRELEAAAERIWMNYNLEHEEGFIARYGRSYL